MIKLLKKNIRTNIKMKSNMNGQNEINPNFRGPKVYFTLYFY